MLLDILLLCMIICYLTPIYIVYTNGNNETISVSSIVRQHKYTILFCMLFMGFFSLLYEYNRKPQQNVKLIQSYCRNKIPIELSFISIFIILIGIYGVIIINNTKILHYFFAIMVFIFILVFMMIHCYFTKNILLIILFIIQVILSFLVVVSNKRFYNIQTYLIVNFAVFFIILHFIFRNS